MVTQEGGITDSMSCFLSPLMATALITTIPPILLFMFVQRYVVSGMTLGSVKG